MSISYQSIGENAVTMRAATGLKEGFPCFPNANHTVSKCNEGDEFFGIALKVRDGFATVIYHGFVTIPYSGTAPTPGLCALAGDGNGKIAVAEDATLRWVMAVDTTAKTVTVLL